MARETAIMVAMGVARVAGCAVYVLLVEGGYVVSRWCDDDPREVALVVGESGVVWG